MMTRGDVIDVEWDDWSQAPEPEAITGDWSDATPLCPRCCNKIDQLDHYCSRCMFAVGQFTPYIPFVNIPFLCEPFQIMWQRVWIPRGETRGKRQAYSVALIIAGLISGYGWILLIALPLWIMRPQYPPGHCQSCGYDLRATSDRCPECGAAIPSAAAAPQP